METMVLVDHHRLLCNVDAFLRTDRKTRSTANTARANYKAGNRMFCVADHDAVAQNIRRVADVKIFTIGVHTRS